MRILLHKVTVRTDLKPPLVERVRRFEELCTTLRGHVIPLATNLTVVAPEMEQIARLETGAPVRYGLTTRR